MNKYCAVIVENRFDVSQIIEDHKKFLPDTFDVIHINDKSIKSEFDYNTKLTSQSFWSDLYRYERVLIFQHDSKLLREGIEEFYEYDFIGAPLYHIDFPCMNGGLSLRNPKAMLEICSHTRWNTKLGNEDIFYCNIMKGFPDKYKLPTKEVAQRFSVETIFSLHSLGVHCPEKWHSVEDVKKLLSQYGQQST